MTDATSIGSDAAAGRTWISRRLALSTFGGATLAAFVAACGSSTKSATLSFVSTSAASTSIDATTSCATLTAEQEQGPYYYPAAAVRSDITDGKEGLPLRLRLNVQEVNTCKPVSNAAIDVWQADALGNYSDTASGLFLRGLQTTDSNGLASFMSIYPGWYPARTNHVHVKVHIGGTAGSAYSGGHVSHTGNVFFPEDISVAVAKLAPYTNNTNTRVTQNRDPVFTSQNGSGSIMTLTAIDSSDPTKGYIAAITLGIDPNATPASIGIAGTVT